MASAKNTSLSQNEKDILRARIMEVIRQNPFPATQKKVAIISPYSVFLIVRNHILASALIVLFFISSTGTLLAEKALPGNTLYGIKTGVNEKVLGLFATSPQAKAEWQLTLADRRLSESETLATQDKLTPEESAQLQASFDEHTRLALNANDSDSVEVPLHAGVTSTTAVQVPTIMRPMSMQAISAPLKKEKGKKIATTTPVTHVSLDQIATLRSQVVAKKAEFEGYKDQLIQQNQFIRLKGRSLVAEKLLFSAREALKQGDEHSADSLFSQAKVSFAMAATSTMNSIDAETISASTTPRDDGKKESASTTSTTLPTISTEGSILDSQDH